MSEIITKTFMRTSFQWSDLKGRSDDDRAIFAFACFARSELSSLIKILFQALHIADSSSVDSFVSIQRNMLIRLLVGKVFEFATSIDGKSAELPDVSPAIKDAITLARQEILQAKELPSWEIAKTLRDKAAFHYDIGKIRKNIRSELDDFAADFLIAEEDGNCVFPLGEVIVGGNLRESDFDCLFDMVTRVLSISKTFHLAVLDSILPNELRAAKEKIERVDFPAELIATATTRLPVIRLAT